MSFPNKVITTQNQSLENTVYFYPKQLKISYSSVEDLKAYLIKLFSQDVRLEEKLKQCNTFLNFILKELYKEGTLKVDHTMVISDPVVDNSIFLQAIELSFQKTITSKTTFTRLSRSQIIKRQILIALFIEKEHLFKDFLSILLTKGTIHSRILSTDINLQEHSKIKFKATRELEEYIANFLTRKALLSQGCSIHTLKMYLYIIIELVIWYSRSLTIIERSVEVNPSILSTAIKIVDNFYITNPKFIKMLQGKLIGYIIKFLN